MPRIFIRSVDSEKGIRCSWYDKVTGRRYLHLDWDNPFGFTTGEVDTRNGHYAWALERGFLIWDNFPNEIEHPKTVDVNYDFVEDKHEVWLEATYDKFKIVERVVVHSTADMDEPQFNRTSL
jgi:hypothetical protein